MASDGTEHAPERGLPPPGTAYFYLGLLIAAYIGVYLCRKNLAVAVPILQQEWGLSKEQLGLIGSVSTIAYAVGKFVFGPVVDAVGGRRALFGSMTLVALFGFLGAFAPGLWFLLVLYSLNRLSGSASWAAMVKLVPEWFGQRQLAFAYGLLSLSFVFGGALAVALAGFVAHVSNESSIAVLGVPSLLLFLILVGCYFLIPAPAGPAQASGRKSQGISLQQLATLFKEPAFLVLLGLSFTLTMLRETFNFWTVDFIRTEGGAGVSSSLAALFSTPFDLFGAVGILLMGWVLGRLTNTGRRNLLVGILLLLVVCLAAFPIFFGKGIVVLGLGVGLVGFLVYGPYSLLAGVFAVEIRGKEFAGTVSGLVDGAGYVAGVVSGVIFGRLLTLGGYTLGLQALAVVTLVAAVLCCFLRFKPHAGDPATAAAAPAKPEMPVNR